ncbi:PAS domain-containing protein [Rhodobacter sp. NSM]|uniref:PAS domain-containing protein n=1 Tax=Rhodobacter sp. NSM TaxID=3457501 RepID=UPI003FD5169F
MSEGHLRSSSSGGDEDDVRDAVAILAPYGRDATVAGGLLARDGVRTILAISPDDLAGLVRRQVGAVLATEEALSTPDLPMLEDALASQPAWSDLPFIVLANATAGTRSPEARRRMDNLGNAVLLSRPLHSEELLRAVRSALKARARQHEARERMEELLLREGQVRDSEAKFHAIANTVDQMIWSTLPDGYHDYYNARWYEFTGVPEGSTDGEAWNGMFHPDDRERAWAAWHRSLASGEPYEIEYRLRHRSGAYRWVLGRAQAARDSRGRIVRWYGSCTDIHDEVTAREAKVHDLTRQRDQAWNLSLDLMAVVSADGTLAVVNEAWTRILGWQAHQMLDRPLTSFVHPDDAAEAGRVFASAAVSPLTDPFECRLRHRDDGYRWFAWTASGHDGKIFAAGRDVTERRARDAALATAEAALRQSQKLEMIGQLTGGIAHDYNNLLMAIRSSIEIAIRRLPPGHDTLRFLHNAIAATERGAGLTQRMLAFARKQDLHVGVLEFGQVLPGLRDLLQRSLGPQIEIVIEIPETLPKVRADTNQLEMALLNLALNGRDAMEGDGRLTIGARAVDETAAADLAPGSYLEIWVTDTGGGMDEATLARAMEPFFTTKGVGKGTGLGLSMIHGLAKQSGGSFRLESRPRAGTTAFIYLPVFHEPERPEPVAPPVPMVADPARKPRHRLTILTVDDDILVSMGTVGMLEELGHEVIEAHSGAEALEAMRERDDIDLLITDQAMPRMTGNELARQVHEMRPDLPIVLATGYAELPGGMASCITAKLDKPFSDAALARLLSELFHLVDS